MTSKLTTSEFIKKAEIKHGDKYDYSSTVYDVSRSKVKISCPSHGVFSQLARNHLHGQGCPVCAGRVLKTKVEFIKDAVRVHGSTYDYDDVTYVNNNTNVMIKCALHGRFSQRPGHHISGHGCQLCAQKKCADKKRSDNQSFINKANAIHNGKYDYKLVQYSNIDSDIVIICSNHGEFNQRPYSHLKGAGCPSCSKTGFNPLTNAFVYILVSECGQYIKIGITGNTGRRINKLKRTTPFEFNIIEVFSAGGEYAQLIERTLHDLGVSSNFKGFDGCTEWFKYDGEILTIARTILT